jgi:acetyltransferase EpsM
MRRKLLIWGAAGHARVVADIVQLVDSHEIVGFLDDLQPAPRTEPGLSAPVLGGRELLPRLRSDGVTDLLVAIGDCNVRLDLAERALAYGFDLPTVIHPRATLAGDVTVGQGTVVCAGAIVAPAARIGANVIVNTAATVDHESVIEDGAHISPGAHLAGNVHVGRGAWICIGAIIGPRVHVGAGAVLGAGSVLLEDLPPGILAYGSPAVAVREAQRV